ncbi:toprim domain protein [Mycobacterium xenopi 4042]|uniref:Toprim domain protein n=1 Tax=Mycobacterium xenopi 4042 TaxID=1299334 RepID=X8EEE6_MYCXE|nr:toprim domain protein [Mycobacterium xenopi 4042]
MIIATDPNTEGEATATYLMRVLRDIPGLTVTRIASGLPMGGDLEFADELTLAALCSAGAPWRDLRRCVEPVTSERFTRTSAR